MSLSYSLRLGQPTEATTERRPFTLPERDIDHVNTSLCKFTTRVRKQLSAPLNETQSPMSALEWYALACSEDGPNAQQMAMLQTHNGVVQDFDKGGFGEFRIMRVLEELRQEGLIDDFVTDYKLPRVREERSSLAPGKHAYQDLFTGKSKSLDALKIDALVSKVQPNGEHLYFPLQIKFKTGHNNRFSGGIHLQQAEAAELRRKFPNLKRCFDNLQKQGQTLAVAHHYHIVHLARKEAGTGIERSPLKSKPKTELKDEILNTMNDPRKTFSLEKPIDHFWGIPLLNKLLEEHLLEGRPQGGQ